MGTEYLHANTGLILTVHADVSGGFYALVPALPGCGSQGETEKEAIDNAVDALSVVLDVIQEDDPNRYKDLLGNSVVGETAAVVSSTVSGTRMQWATA